MSKIIHGMYGTPLYRVWSGIRNRCSLNSREKDLKYYGLLGIKVCDEWKNFLPFYNWAISNNWQKGLHVDRIDGTKGYCPENCRIVTARVNANNRKDNFKIEFNGESRTPAEWSRITGIKKSTIRMRVLRRKWTIEKSLTTKAHNRA